MNTSSKLCLALLCLSVAGCGAVQQARQAANSAQKKNELKVLALTYHNFHDMNRRGPKDWSEFVTFAQQSGGAVEIQALQSEGYDVLFGVSFKDITIGTSNCIMAYKPGDEQTGGDVVMMDGAAFTMTAEALQAALAERDSLQLSSDEDAPAEDTPAEGQQPESQE